MPGARNRRTTALLELAGAGETPVAFALRVMRDGSQAPDLRMMAARISAPFVHPKPQPEARIVNFEVPEKLGPENLTAVHETVIRAVAAGDLAVEDARDISATLETHRRFVETAELAQRIAALEAERGQGALVNLGVSNAGT
jgi:hypothetical protein